MQVLRVLVSSYVSLRMVSIVSILHVKVNVDQLQVFPFLLFGIDGGGGGGQLQQVQKIASLFFKAGSGSAKSACGFTTLVISQKLRHPDRR